MKAQKILFNACMYTKNPPGVGINSREAYNALTEKLKKNNIEFVVYAYAKEGLKEPGAVSLIKLPLLLELMLRRFISFHRLVWNIFYLPVLARKYDLVYSFTSYGSPFLKKQVITIHDLICFQFPKQNRFQYLYFKTIVPAIVKSCMKVVIISHFTKQDVMKYYKTPANKLDVIYCGHDHLNVLAAHNEEADAKELQSITGGRPFFFTAGASYSHKNVDTLITAMQAVPNHLLLVTGPDNSYYNYLKSLAKENNYTNIVFLNYVSDSFLKLLYKECVANVYISYYEGFGATPLEAAMNDKISVVSNKSVLPEIYGDSVLYVNPDDINDVKDVLIKVSRPGFNASVYKSKFPALAKKYSWSNMADGIINVISFCLGNKQKQKTSLNLKAGHASEA